MNTIIKSNHECNNIDSINILSNYNNAILSVLQGNDIQETENEEQYTYSRNNEEVGYITFTTPNSNIAHINKLVTVNQRYSDHIAIDPKQYDIDKFDKVSIKLGDIKMKGLGTRMLKRFLEKVQKQGYTGVTLIYNHSSRPFYEKVCERLKSSNIIKAYSNIMNTITFSL